jgi:pantoate--beta-alanine ligase
MGALHQGHQALMRAARAQCDFVIASAYVNPTQFAPGEDFDSYPRTPEHDADIADAGGVDLLWRPDTDEMYGAGDTTTVTIGALGERLCGEYRPGHFDGVATVVVKLLGAVQPDVLYLGQKDYQQVVVLTRVVRDLRIPVEVRRVPTVRDPDGLAVSSRNRYLSRAEREAALAIPRAHDAASAMVADGELSAGRLSARVEAVLAAAPLLRTQYVEIVEPDTLEAVPRLHGPAVLLVAAHVGDTRLIDNRVLEPAHETSSSTTPAPGTAPTPTSGAHR